MRLHFYTRNPRKIELLHTLLAEKGAECEIVQEEPAPEIQARTCEQVVRHALASAAHEPAVAEDSGLFIPALSGFPGTITAYIQQVLKPRHLLRLLAPLPKQAYFRSAIGVRIAGEVKIFTGELHGTIAERPVGSSEHWLDTLFVPLGSSKSLAQMSPQERLAVSDWSRSFGALAEHIAQTLSP